MLDQVAYTIQNHWKPETCTELVVIIAAWLPAGLPTTRSSRFHKLCSRTDCATSSPVSSPIPSMFRVDYVHGSFGQTAGIWESWIVVCQFPDLTIYKTACGACNIALQNAKSGQGGCTYGFCTLRSIRGVRQNQYGGYASKSRTPSMSIVVGNQPMSRAGVRLRPFPYH